MHDDPPGRAGREVSGIRLQGEVMNNNKFKGRPFRDDDIRTIAEEVVYLMENGYRANDKAQVLEGLEVALDGSPPGGLETMDRDAVA